MKARGDAIAPWAVNPLDCALLKPNILKATEKLNGIACYNILAIDAGNQVLQPVEPEARSPKAPRRHN